MKYSPLSSSRSIYIQIDKLINSSTVGKTRTFSSTHSTRKIIAHGFCFLQIQIANGELHNNSRSERNN
jgi:hypothetical protein